MEFRALKLYSPNGPRNGVVIIFLTQNSKTLWLSKISEMINLCAPDPLLPISSSPTSAGTPPRSPYQNGNQRRGSVGTVFSGSESPPNSAHAPVKIENDSPTHMRNSPILISRTCSLFSFNGEEKPTTDAK